MFDWSCEFWMCWLLNSQITQQTWMVTAVCLFLFFCLFVFYKENAPLTFSLCWIRLRVWPSDRNLPTFILTRSKRLPCASLMNSGTCKILFHTLSHTHTNTHTFCDYIKIRSLVYNAGKAWQKIPPSLGAWPQTLTTPITTLWKQKVIFILFQ